MSDESASPITSSDDAPAQEVGPFSMVADPTRIDRLRRLIESRTGIFHEMRTTREGRISRIDCSCGHGGSPTEKGAHPATAYLTHLHEIAIRLDILP